MNNSENNTNWAISSKGNNWKRINGVVLIVGYNKASGKYWARRGNDFIKGSFETEQSAMSALESNTANSNSYEAHDE